jgi:hypothetical protein
MYVSKVLDVGPVMVEDAGGVFVYFGLPDHFHASTLRGKVEPAYSSKQ